MNRTDPLGSCFWTDDLPGYGPTVDWQTQLHSRRLTSTDRASSNYDSHSTEHLIGANRERSPVGYPGARQESVAVNAGGHFRDTLQESGYLSGRCDQRQLQTTFRDKNHLNVG